MTTLNQALGAAGAAGSIASGHVTPNAIGALATAIGAPSSVTRPISAVGGAVNGLQAVGNLASGNGSVGDVGHAVQAAGQVAQATGNNGLASTLGQLTKPLGTLGALAAGYQAVTNPNLVSGTNLLASLINPLAGTYNLAASIFGLPSIGEGVSNLAAGQNDGYGPLSSVSSFLTGSQGYADPRDAAAKGLGVANTAPPPPTGYLSNFLAQTAPANEQGDGAPSPGTTVPSAPPTVSVAPGGDPFGGPGPSDNAGGGGDG